MAGSNQPTRTVKPFAIPVDPILRVAGTYKGITFYGDTYAGKGFFIRIHDVIQANRDCLNELLEVVPQYEEEFEALSIVGHSASGIEDANLADWILEAIAQGQMSREDLKKRGKELLRERRERAQQENERQRSREVKVAKKVSGYVYVVRCGSRYKIGLSKDPNRRVKELATYCPDALHIVCKIFSADMMGLEAELHQLFRSKRLHGEWFDLDAIDIEHIQNAHVERQHETD